MKVTHTTLQTADSRLSSAFEISPEALSYFKDLISKAIEKSYCEIDVEPGYFFHAQVKGSTLTAQVTFGDTILVRMAVVTKSKDATKAWQVLHDESKLLPKTDPLKTPSVPFIAVSLQPDLDYYGDASMWLGDFERCLAWTWVSLCKNRDNHD